MNCSNLSGEVPRVLRTLFMFVLMLAVFGPVTYTHAREKEESHPGKKACGSDREKLDEVLESMPIRDEDVAGNESEELEDEKAAGRDE
ncbi:MAG: hypothetical protein GF409_03485 [Candidatus Omnitrophica bacterium]|nr:hypothetical protein [Candidatus Omnitrophota bacterium]